MKYTGIRLEQLTDVEKYQFWELGMRGGISMICKRQANANNKYMTTFDPSQESSFIMPFDCVNLYGYALSDYLPVANFKWLSSSDVEKINPDIIQSWGDHDHLYWIYTTV